MFPLALSSADTEAFEAALRSAVRRVSYKASLLTKDGEPLPTPLMLKGGEVIVDFTRPRQEPSHTARAVLIDPDRRLNVDTTDVASGGLWFSKMLHLEWGIWVTALDRWVWVDIFTGPILTVERTGAEVKLHAQGKDAQHLPPHSFFRSFSVRRHTRIHKAIRALFEARGETSFSLDDTTKRLARDKTWGAFQSPWRAGQNLAEAGGDKQLFYRGNGTLRLRDIPNQPSWRYTEGRDAITTGDAVERFSLVNVFNAVIVRGERTVKVAVKTTTELTERSLAGATTIKVKSTKDFANDRTVEVGGAGAGDPEVRLITNVNEGTKTITLSRALSVRHSKGGPVKVRYREERARAVVARAKLVQQHPLSDHALTGGKRPRVKVERRPNIHKHKTAKDRATAIARRMKVGVEHSVSLTCLTVPHHEPLDLVALDVDGIDRRIRLRRFTIPLEQDTPQEINWLDRKEVPRRKRRGRRG